MNKHLDIKSDSLWKLMWNMSLPGIMGMILVSINTFVDALYVVYFIGEEALAGISLVMPLTLVTNAVMAMLAAGFASVLSRAIGAGEVLIQQKVLSNLLGTSLVVSCILSGSGFLLSGKLLTWMGASGNVWLYAAAYYETWVWGSFFVIFGIAANGLIRAEGRMSEAMKYTMSSVLLNIILAPLLMHVLDLGMRGAALASILAMGVYTLLTLRYFLSGAASFSTGKLRINLDPVLLREVCSVGLSSFLIQLMNFARQTCIFKSMAHYGSDKDLAFLAAVFRIFTFCVMPVFGFLQVLQPVVGINYGAGNYDRCVRAVIVFRTASILFLLMIGLPLMIFTPAVISLMIPGRVISGEDIHHFRLVFAMMPLLPVASSTLVFFQATGNGKRSSLMSVVRELLFIILIILFPFLYGMAGIYYSILLEHFFYIGLVFILGSYEFKKLKAMPVPL